MSKWICIFKEKRVLGTESVVRSHSLHYLMLIYIIGTIVQTMAKVH